jgi:hypothetical protein
MAEWKEIILSGDAAPLNSLTLDTALDENEGGTGKSSYVKGDLLIGNPTAGGLERLPILTSNITDKILKISTDVGEPNRGNIGWLEDSIGAALNEVTTNTGNQITIANSTSTPEVSITTAAVADNETALATGDQINDYFSNNFNNLQGTVTSIGAADGTAQSSLTLTASGPSDNAYTLTLGGSLSNIGTDQLANNNVTIGSTTVNLGNTSTTLAGLTGLDFTAADASIAASIGANTLSIGGGTSEVLFAGNLRVEGTASFENTDNLRIKDKVFIVASGSSGVQTGGFLVQQQTIGGNHIGVFFGFKTAANYGVQKGRFGFTNANIESIEDGTSTPDGTTSKPFIQSVVVDTAAEATAPTTAPTFGGSVAGQGELHVMKTAERVFVYI